MSERLGDMVFYGLDRDAHLTGDLFIAASMESLENDNLLSDGGQGLDGGIDLAGHLQLPVCGGFHGFLGEGLQMHHLQLTLGRLFFDVVD